MLEAALGEQLEEVRVGTQVQWRLVLVVLYLEVCTVGGQEDGNGGTALLVRVARYQSLEWGQNRGKVGEERERGERHVKESFF